MNRRGARKGRAAREGSAARAEGVNPAGTRVLLVCGARRACESIASGLESRGVSVERASSPADALAAAAHERFDAALVQGELMNGRGIELARSLHELDAGLGIAVFAEQATLDDAVIAMRAGVLDLIVDPQGSETFLDRAGAVIERSRGVRASQVRLERLRRVCRRLNAARAEVTTQVGSLCTDLATAYQELSDQLTRVGLATEFNSLVRQELDLESLLRTVLEFLLAKLGPTNAAVFLPGSSGDYSLGAYVNYDCPRDSTEVLLEHLAGVMPARFENEPGVTLLPTEAALRSRLGDDADWLHGHALACFACRHEDECLAVVSLFRDRRTGFTPEQLGMLAAVSELFARQLARVIHVHHRHVPKHQWGDDREDDIDLAA